MVVPRATVVSLILSLAACSVGEVPPGGGGSTDAGNNAAQAAKFDTVIKPLVTPRCTSCHGGTTAPNLTSYATLADIYKMGPSATNKLIIEAADGAQHNGVPYFSTAEKMTVANWIDGK
jgi:hypothetical protein